ncbi:MAG: dTDP-4-dehydrorhamnose reductase [Armatimonadetes bacterium]|nr:dTDP-4-dehydrorhamnose reductase [Armatimonadota bacterium]
MPVSSREAILILGCRGMLGTACMRSFGPEAIGCDFAEFDIADRDRTIQAIEGLAPVLIVNCAAATDVDRCETDREYADNANTLGPRNIAEAAAAVGARMIHVSTDFVFDGAKGEPYVETDEPHPLSYYGLSKLQGEEGVLAALPTAAVVRTSWLYGAGETHFPAKVLRWAGSNPQIRVADDQIGSPTYAEDLALALKALAATDAGGIFHLGGSGCATRYEWAQETLALAGSDTKITPASSAEFPLPAARPANSCLDCSNAAALGVMLPPWRDGLSRYIRTREPPARMTSGKSRPGRMGS